MNLIHPSDSDIICRLSAALRLDEILLVVDIVLSILGVPVFISENFLLLERILTFPEFLSAMRISRSWIWSLVFRDIELILLGIRFHPPFLFIFEPSAWHIQIKIVVRFNGWICPKEDFPVIIDTFKDRSKTNIEKCNILIGL